MFKKLGEKSKETKKILYPDCKEEITLDINFEIN